MNKDQFTYRREQTVSVTFDGMESAFRLVAPSAKANDTALIEAQHMHKKVVELIPDMTQSLQNVYLAQDTALLVEGLLEMEQEQLVTKAALTLVKGEPGYAENLAAKANALLNARRDELAALEKAQMVEKLVAAEVNRQLERSWVNASCYALLAQCLYDNDAQRIFPSADAMKETLPAEVMEKLSDALVEFMNARGNAQVFPKPCISND